MTPINIRLSAIRSVSIIAIPSETITGKEFRYSNIARILTRDGGDYDIIFDKRGEPVVDNSLVKRVADYYGKKFEAILFDGRAAYAQINDSCQKHGPAHTDVTTGNSLREVRIRNTLKTG
jgi:hypothetical protein